MAREMFRAVAVLALLCGVAGAQPATPPAVPSPDAGGRHLRIQTQHGAVHVWMPPGYRRDRAGIVLYVHGYYTDVDRAWTEHRLAEQFRASGRNALFIACEAPAGLASSVSWPRLGALLAEVRRQTGLLMPWGPVVALAHSGGYRTAVRWLGEPRLSELVLIDALYGEEREFAAWLTDDPRRRLVLVGADTLRWTEPLARELAATGVPARSLERLPAHAAELEPGAHDARLLYLRSEVGHMDLVAGGRALPLLLSLTQLGAVAPAP